jgi:hypothetical protein
MAKASLLSFKKFKGKTVITELKTEAKIDPSVFAKSTLDLILALPADMPVMVVQLHLNEMCHTSFQTYECVNWEKLETKDFHAMHLASRTMC